MTVVRSQFIDVGTGLPRAGIRVYAALVAPASWTAPGQQQIIGRAETVSDKHGWYKLDLPPQSHYEVQGTYYTVREWGNATWTIIVPDSPGPHMIRDLLVNEPPEIAPYVPISTFDSLRDVDNSGRAVGDLVGVGMDGRLGFFPPSAAVAAPNWWQGEGEPLDVIVGASPNDIYVDTVTGTFYILK